jgi:hypothetical protein
MEEHQAQTATPNPPIARISSDALALAKGQIQMQDRALDEALELTFPASDPIAISPYVPDGTPASLG